MGRLFGIVWLLMYVKYQQDVMEGHQSFVMNHMIYLHFFLTKRCNNLLNVWTNYSGLMRNHSFFYQTQLWIQKELLVGCFIEIVVMFIISDTLVMSFYG